MNQEITYSEETPITLSKKDWDELTSFDYAMMFGISKGVAFKKIVSQDIDEDGFLKGNYMGVFDEPIWSQEEQTYKSEITYYPVIVNEQ